MTDYTESCSVEITLTAEQVQQAFYLFSAAEEAIDSTYGFYETWEKGDPDKPEHPLIKLSEYLNDDLKTFFGDWPVGQRLMAGHHLKDLIMAIAREEGIALSDADEWDGSYNPFGGTAMRRYPGNATVEPFFQLIGTDAAAAAVMTTWLLDYFNKSDMVTFTYTCTSDATEPTAVAFACTAEGWESHSLTTWIHAQLEAHNEKGNS